MAFLNIWTREAPFAELANSRKVEAAVRNGQRPEKPAVDIDLPPEMEQEFWLLLTKMWAHDPANRPPSDDMQSQLEVIFAPLLEQHKLHGQNFQTPEKRRKWRTFMGVRFWR